MTAHHAIRCRCGQLRGEVSHPGDARRGVCYCKDCQSFAHFLGRADAVLDERGGTDLISTRQSRVSFSRGSERIACMALSPNGLLRWYASCCNTPLGNTPRNLKLSHVGLVHSCLEDPASSLDASFGPVQMQVNTGSAKAPVAATPVGTVMSVLRLAAGLLRARLDGSYRRTPFFDAASGAPVATPQVLSREQRERLRAAL
jgi:hypothetical protein